MRFARIFQHRAARQQQERIESLGASTLDLRWEAHALGLTTVVLALDGALSALLADSRTTTQEDTNG